jgi:hypothetical protein
LYTDYEPTGKEPITNTAISVYTDYEPTGREPITNTAISLYMYYNESIAGIVPSLNIGLAMKVLKACNSIPCIASPVVNIAYQLTDL